MEKTPVKFYRIKNQILVAIKYTFYFYAKNTKS